MSFPVTGYALRNGEFKLLYNGERVEFCNLLDREPSDEQQAQFDALTGLANELRSGT